MKVINIKNIAIGEKTPKICVSLMGKDKEEIKKQLQQMQNVSFDVLEWRMDYLDSLNDVVEIAKMIQMYRNDTVLLYTFRTLQEGGEKAISKAAYINVYKKLIDYKVCDMIDVEMFMDEEVCHTLCTYAHAFNIYVVGSYHDFNKTPSKKELVERFAYMQEKEADVCKIACMPNNKVDVKTIMQATKQRYIEATTPLIAISMGELGKVTRIKGKSFGSALTFGCIHKASAPGQIELEELKQLLKKEDEVIY